MSKGIKKEQLLKIFVEISEYKENLKKINEPGDVFSLAIEKVTDWKKEHFIALYIDALNRVMDIKIISIGTLDSIVVNPREIFGPAMELRAAKIIIAHNHPSGNINPSQQDINLTKRAIFCGEMLGVPVVDHIIFSCVKHLSLQKMEIIDFTSVEKNLMKMFYEDNIRYSKQP